VHHTNEIAQSQCSSASTPWVNYWLHYQFLNINGDKISKSKGSVIELIDIADLGYSPEDLRMFYLQAHYRSFQDFTWDGLEAAKNSRLNLRKKLLTYQPQDTFDPELTDFMSEVLCDDLNTPQLLARIFSSYDALDNELAGAIKRYDDTILKLGLFEPEEVIDTPTEIKSLAEQRRQAKLDKDYSKADELRSQLTQ